jgi:Fe-S cluster biogenesis protein NfuA
MEIPFDNDELFEAINNIIDSRIRPTLAKDGGDIKLLKVKSPEVFLQLQGACVGCPSSATTLKYVVEKDIKTFIHPKLEIVHVPVS